jgi:hypothetical protein
MELSRTIKATTCRRRFLAIFIAGFLSMFKVKVPGCNCCVRPFAGSLTEAHGEGKSAHPARFFSVLKKIVFV